VTGDWSTATFDGLVTVQQRSIAKWSACQRWEWLAEALELARLSGALERAFLDKQASIDELWRPGI